MGVVDAITDLVTSSLRIVILVLALVGIAAIVFWFLKKSEDEEPETEAPSIEADRLCPCVFRISANGSESLTNSRTK